MNRVMVTISCTTYNHENYISDAIESFLMQKTNFEYEIIIHDDASTDRTADIIRDYEMKYPNLIKPIYQIENQYSKGVHVGNIIIDQAKGKYIAICEGDDYWTDPHKLQKQVDYMQSNPECSLCVHAGKLMSASRKKIISYYRPNKGNKLYEVSEVIEGGGGLFLTNSMLFVNKLTQQRPDFLENSPVGDYPLTINLSLQGTVFYMDEFMSAYRVGDSGSWTVKNNSNIEKKKKHYDDITDMLDQINQYTKYKYDEIIKKKKLRNEFFLLLEDRDFNGAKEKKYKDVYLNLGYKRKMFILLDQFCPYAAKLIKLVQRKLIR